ncbi:unnamed protein product [Coccothraustes coccothraustes]
MATSCAASYGALVLVGDSRRSAECRAWSAAGTTENRFSPGEPFGVLLPRQPLSGPQAGRRRAAGTGRDGTGRDGTGRDGAERGAAPNAALSKARSVPQTQTACPRPGRDGMGLGSSGFRNRPWEGSSQPVPPRDLRRGAAPDPPPRPPLPSPGRRKDK